MNPTEPAAIPAQAFDRLHLRVRFAEVRPAAAAVGTALGYPGGEMPEPVLRAVEQMLELAESLGSIAGGYVLYPEVAVDGARHCLEVRGLTFRVGKAVCGQLARAEGLAVFLCTCGRGIEQAAHKLASSGDLFTAFIADTLGSMVVELAMDRLERVLARSMAERGLAITNRCSPGYCGWHVSEQQKLFRLLPRGYCGVSLTDTSLMQPIKTVSGFIGTGRQVRRTPYTCHLCDLKDCCLYRRLHQGSLVASGVEHG